MASFTQLLDTTPENSATYLADFSVAVRPNQLYFTVLYCTVLYCTAGEAGPAGRQDVCTARQVKGPMIPILNMCHYSIDTCSLKGVKPSEPVDLYHHNIQTATRAYRCRAK